MKNKPLQMGNSLYTDLDRRLRGCHTGHAEPQAKNLVSGAVLEDQILRLNPQDDSGSRERRNARPRSGRIFRRRKTVAAVLLGFTVSGCSLAPKFERPEMAIPAGWSQVANVGLTSEQDSKPFWEQFGSQELDQLVQRALSQNLDLQAALHRIDEARAQAKVAGAPLYPTVQVSGNSSRTVKNPVDVNAAQSATLINYEVDLWGKNRNQSDAANYRATATAFDRDALRLVITSDVTNYYTDILALNDRIRIAQNNFNNAQEVLRIIEARYAAGMVSGLEVSQQRVAVNGFQSALSNLIQQRTTAGNALAILVGMAPQSFDPSKADLNTLAMPEVNLTPPATLITARPDIESAETNLKAANADIGAARAAFFPSLTLGNTMNIAAGFGNPAASAVSLAANILAPIFTGGKLTGNLEDVTARQKELAAQYQKTVLTAFQEVEDALANLKNSDQQVALSEQTVAESQKAYDIAKARFDAGAVDYLNLLETQRSLYQAQDNQIANEAAQLQAFVQVRKALGA